MAKISTVTSFDSVPSGESAPGTPCVSTQRCQPDIGTRIARLGAPLIAIALGLLPGIAQARCSDVALVLAIDASSSISVEEFNLQIAGYVAALTSAPVMDSFREAGLVDVTALFWADSAYPAQIVPWQRVTSAHDLHNFATALSTMERQIGGNTDLGVGLKRSIDLLTDDDVCAERLVIDVSGDGRATIVARRDGFVSVSAMRRRAEDEGIVVNALAIRGDDPALGDYFRTNLATGLGSFVMEVDGFDTFHKAITEKLMKEVLSGEPLQCAPRPAEINCS
jgi:Protein of unknown function (DUF1194)